jgi:hypothetical protein
MDFGKLSSNEKTAAVAAVVVVLAGIISNWGGLVWLSVIAAAAAVVILLLPQLSAGTTLPGSRGSWLVALGAVAAVGTIIELLRFMGYFFNSLDDYRTWLFAIALIASLVLAWVGWQEFQREGGRFNIGTDAGRSAPAAPAAAAAPPAAEPAPPPPPPAAPPPASPEPMASGMASEADDEDDEDQRPMG